MTESPNEPPPEPPTELPTEPGRKTERLALRVVPLPRDTNQYETVFGGVILSWLDQAGFIEARRHGKHRWVTVSIDRVDFHAPVHVGDTVSFYARTVRTGRSSVKVHIRVEADRYLSHDTVLVTEADMTMVSVDAAGRAIPFTSPATVATELPS